MDYLSTEQQQALAQLREIINGADDDVAIGVLSSVDWDVHVRCFFLSFQLIVLTHV
jgi:hypothetical protein